MRTATATQPQSEPEIVESETVSGSNPVEMVVTPASETLAPNVGRTWATLKKQGAGAVVAVGFYSALTAIGVHAALLAGLETRPSPELFAWLGVSVFPTTLPAAVIGLSAGMLAALVYVRQLKAPKTFWLLTILASIPVVIIEGLMGYGGAWLLLPDADTMQSGVEFRLLVASLALVGVAAINWAAVATWFGLAEENELRIYATDWGEPRSVMIAPPEEPAPPLLDNMLD